MASRRKRTPLERLHQKALGGQTLIQRSRSESPAAKAAFHQVSGAGRSHVKREFFGLSPADETAIVDLVEHDIERRLKGRG